MRSLEQLVNVTTTVRNPGDAEGKLVVQAPAELAMIELDRERLREQRTLEDLVPAEAAAVANALVRHATTPFITKYKGGMASVWPIERQWRETDNGRQHRYALTRQGLLDVINIVEGGSVIDARDFGHDRALTLPELETVRLGVAELAVAHEVQGYIDWPTIVTAHRNDPTN